MGRKKEKLPKGFEFPPEIFWITPDGGVLSIIGHLSAMQGRPSTFGLASSPETHAEIEDAFAKLFSEGWVRGRWSLVDQVASFHMERPRGGPMGNAYDFVVKYAAYIDKVEIDFADPSWFKAARDFPKEQFLGQMFPVSWGLNPKRKGG